MSQLMQRAFELAIGLPEDRQDEIGEMLLLVIDQERSPLRLSPAQQDEVRRRLSVPGSVASSAEADAVFTKLGE
ncbi:MAG: hypothetical protein ACKVS5_07550 [Parvularculaceae bacterium]